MNITLVVFLAVIVFLLYVGLWRIKDELKWLLVLTKELIRVLQEIRNELKNKKQ